jgi:hypothetical protein
MTPEEKDELRDWLEETVKYISDDYKEHVDKRINSILDILELLVHKGK